MADPVPTGSDVSAGTYRCTECGQDLTLQSQESLPPCPSCQNTSFETVRGGDSAQDPYPDR
jgi:Zn finger protein HypA/HybF involved in hydrogenase expression